MKHDTTSKAALPIGESVALMALLISLVALSIDAMLPALPAIGADLGAGGENEAQLVLSALFLGLAAGQFDLRAGVGQRRAQARDLCRPRPVHGRLRAVDLRTGL